jgi:hypothetical protein
LSTKDKKSIGEKRFFVKEGKMKEFGLKPTYRFATSAEASRFVENSPVSEEVRKQRNPIKTFLPSINFYFSILD